jgi:hypothetical protein
VDLPLYLHIADIRQGFPINSIEPPRTPVFGPFCFVGGIELVFLNRSAEHLAALVELTVVLEHISTISPARSRHHPSVHVAMTAAVVVAQL